LLELMPSSQIDVYVQVLQVSRPRSLHYQCVLCAAPSTLQSPLSQQRVCIHWHKEHIVF